MSLNVRLLIETSRLVTTRQSSTILRTSSRRFHSSRQHNFQFVELLMPLHSTLQSIHASTSLPWYALIPLTTIGLRTFITLPLSIMNRRRTQKQAMLQPLLASMTPILKARLAASPAAQSGKLTVEQIHVLSMKERRKRRVELFRKFKCQSWKSIVLLPMVQIPLWVSMSIIFRSMCGWSVVDGISTQRDLEDENFLWINNLMEPDPYGLLSVFIGITALANVEWNAINAMNPEAKARRNSGAVSVPTIISNISRIGTLMFMTASFQAPSAVCLYWLSSNAFSLCQNLLLDKYLPVRYEPKSLEHIKQEVLNPKPLITEEK